MSRPTSVVTTGQLQAGIAIIFMVLACARGQDVSTSGQPSASSTCEKVEEISLLQTHTTIKAGSPGIHERSVDPSFFGDGNVPTLANSRSSGERVAAPFDVGENAIVQPDGLESVSPWQPSESGLSVVQEAAMPQPDYVLRRQVRPKPRQAAYTPRRAKPAERKRVAPTRIPQVQGEGTKHTEETAYAALEAERLAQREAQQAAEAAAAAARFEGAIDEQPKRNPAAEESEPATPLVETVNLAPPAANFIDSADVPIVRQDQVANMLREGDSLRPVAHSSAHGRMLERAEIEGAANLLFERQEQSMRPGTLEVGTSSRDYAALENAPKTWHDANKQGPQPSRNEVDEWRAALSQKITEEEELRHLMESAKDRSVASTPQMPMPSEQKTCHPMCTWQCEQSQCEEACQPQCDNAQCETRCDASSASLAQSCTMKCGVPQCSTVCHPSCETTDCALCTTTCGKPVCSMECPPQEPQCQTACSHPQCSWQCKAPEACPQPSCKLKCEHPPECRTAQTYEAMPPLPAGWIAVESFTPLKRHLQSMNTSMGRWRQPSQETRTSDGDWAQAPPSRRTLPIPVTSVAAEQDRVRPAPVERFVGQRPARQEIFPRTQRQMVDIPVDVASLLQQLSPARPTTRLSPARRLPWATRLEAGPEEGGQAWNNAESG